MKTILIVIGVIIVIGVFFLRSKTYTNESWDEQCHRDFLKYGPLPDDIDEQEDY